MCVEGDEVSSVGWGWLTRAVDDHAVVLVAALHADTDVVLVDLEATQAVRLLVRRVVEVAHVHLLAQLVALRCFRFVARCCKQVTS